MFLEIILFLFLILFSIALYRWDKNKNRALDLEDLKLLYSYDYKANKQDVNSFLNNFINDCMGDYIMYNIVPDSGLEYITKERENKIREDLVKLVSDRLSDTARKKIALCYNEAYMSHILAEKIFYTVTIYVADFNEPSTKNKPKATKKKALEKLNQMDEANDW